MILKMLKIRPDSMLWNFKGGRIGAESVRALQSVDIFLKVLKNQWCTGGVNYGRERDYYIVHRKITFLHVIYSNTILNFFNSRIKAKLSIVKIPKPWNFMEFLHFKEFLNLPVYGNCGRQAGGIMP